MTNPETTGVDFDFSDVTPPQSDAPAAVAPASAEAPVAEAEATAAPAKSGGRRGRPRTQESIQRDELVLQILKAKGVPMTRAQITEEIPGDVKGGLVYLSLWRMRKAGLVTKVNAEGTANAWVPAQA